MTSTETHDGRRPVVHMPPEPRPIAAADVERWRSVPRIVPGDVANDAGDLWVRGARSDDEPRTIAWGDAVVTPEQAIAAHAHGWADVEETLGGNVKIRRKPNERRAAPGPGEHRFVGQEGGPIECALCGAPMPAEGQVMSICPGRRPDAPSQGEELALDVNSPSYMAAQSEIIRDLAAAYQEATGNDVPVDETEGRLVVMAARLRSEIEVAFAPLAKVVERAHRLGFSVQFGIEVVDHEARMADLVLTRSY